MNDVATQVKQDRDNELKAMAYRSLRQLQAKAFIPNAHTEVISVDDFGQGPRGVAKLTWFDRHDGDFCIGAAPGCTFVTLIVVCDQYGVTRTVATSENHVTHACDRRISEGRDIAKAVAAINNARAV